MRTAETVLSIIRERGQRGLPLERLYRQLYNPNLYLRAYGKIYANRGAMTPGVSSETVDGMSLAKIDRIITRDAKYTENRSAYIPMRIRTAISSPSNRRFHFACIYEASPKNPWGRQSNTTAIRMKVKNMSNVGI